VAPRGTGPEPNFPAYLGSFTDQLSGAIVTRITGDRGQPIPRTEKKWAGRTRSAYNLKQVWSADEKLLFLGIGGPLVLDGETYQVFHSWGPPAPGTWHPVRPDVMIYVKDNAVCEWNARSNVTRQLVRLVGYADFVQSASEDWISADGRLIGVTARREADGKDVGFLVDIDAGKKSSIDFVFAEHGFARKEREYQVCRPSLSGKYVVLRARGGDNGPNPRGEALTVFDLAGKEISRHWAPPHTPGHGDLALTLDREDVMVGRSDDGWPEHSNYYGAVSWNLRANKLLALGPAGSHTSGRAFGLPGWVFASTFGKGGTVFMVKLDGSGETRTICQTWHREPVNYWAQTQAVPSPTGTRVLFASNWGTGPDYNDEEAHSFVADLRKRP
jgi:hypothetical protein